ncbi:hypothetical protein SDC9_26061 [bioreactor metagenome]|uniref:Uncharacterized protein n=1 Tax=bioreactor metagenome TaxID=1076179 RepID=A0A644UM84_9ZZZZ
MNRRGRGDIRSGQDRDARTQGRRDEPARAALFDNAGADGTVLVAGHDDPGVGGVMQIPEHVAGRERREQQILGVHLAGIATKQRVVRAMNDRLSRDRDIPAPVIAAVMGGAFAPVSRPDDGGGVVMVHGIAFSSKRFVYMYT